LNEKISLLAVSYADGGNHAVIMQDFRSLKDKQRNATATNLRQ